MSGRSRAGGTGPLPSGRRTNPVGRGVPIGCLRLTLFLGRGDSNPTDSPDNAGCNGTHQVRIQAGAVRLENTFAL